MTDTTFAVLCEVVAGRRRQEITLLSEAVRAVASSMAGGVPSSGARCARCGVQCEHGPYREQLCNKCALELGNAEIAQRQAKQRGRPA